MEQLEIPVKCAVPGFEQVTVVYNLMASEAQADQLALHMGRNGSSKSVIVRVDGWDAATYGADPWDRDRSPMAFRVWAARKGYARALAQLVNDPNY